MACITPAWSSGKLCLKLKPVYYFLSWIYELVMNLKTWVRVDMPQALLQSYWLKGQATMVLLIKFVFLEVQNNSYNGFWYTNELNRMAFTDPMPHCQNGFNEPFWQCSGHFESYCFKYLLWDAWGQIGMYLPCKHPIIAV